jgi:hypothetical protein
MLYQVLVNYDRERTVSPLRNLMLSRQPPVTATLVAEPADFSCATCPLCQTTYPSLTREGLAAGASWCCARCGQRWNAPRLKTVSGYEAWVARHG